MFLWVGFNFFIIVMLLLDLLVFHKSDHEIKIREALGWSVFWVALALIFNGGIYHFMGHDAGLKFLTGYILERSLSVDNLFVFLLLFNYFKVPAKYQYKILFWGILGALIFRALFIVFGISLINKFHFIIYLFGAFLIFTGIKLFFENEKEMEVEKNFVLKIARRMLPMTDSYEGGKFFVYQMGRLFATPLLIVLLIVETTDIVFAIDSIPAILSVSRDPFIVYSSNAFAILGLRALYFALAGMMTMFHYLNYGLGAILAFVGVKMLLEDVVNIPIAVALGVIAGILALSVAASIMFPKAEDGHGE